MIKISCLNEKARKFVIRHCHDEMEINVFLSGQGTYLVNGVEYPVRVGDVFLFHPRMFHCLYNDSGNSVLSIIKIIFERNDVDDMDSEKTLSDIVKMYNSNEFIYKKIRIPSYSSYSTGIAKICNRMLHEKAEDDSCLKLLLLYVLHKIKNFYLDDSEKEKSANYSCDAVKNIVAYIEDNFTYDITVGFLAEKCNLSINRFTDAFKLYTGVTPKRYINIKRVSQACLMLSNSQKSITEIAFEAGYNSTAAFNKSFLNIVGTTPTMYKKLSNEVWITEGNK